jgi:cell division transport system permease protein
MISPITYFMRHVLALLGALGRLVRRPLGTVLTTFVIALALALPAGLWLIVKNARIATGGLAETVELAVYLRTDVSLPSAQALAERTRQRSGVESVILVSADDALKEFREYAGFGEAIDALGRNPLPHLLRIRPALAQADPVSVAALQRDLSAWPEVESIRYDSEWLQRLEAMFAVLQALFQALAVIFSLGVLAVIGNAIRLEIAGRRAEIEVTKLVGGSDAFIRRPFLYSGLLYGLLGGLLAVLMLGVLGWLLEGPVAALSLEYGSRYSFAGLHPEEGGILLLASSVLGLVGAWIGAARQLKSIDPQP